MRITERELKEIVRGMITEMTSAPTQAAAKLKGQIGPKNKDGTYGIVVTYKGQYADAIKLDLMGTEPPIVAEFEKRVAPGKYVLLNVVRSSGPGNWSLRSIQIISSSSHELPSD